MSVVLFRPTTYMNLSGEALVELMHWYKLEPEDIFVMSDDIDLAPGMMRLRQKAERARTTAGAASSRWPPANSFPRASASARRLRNGS